MRSLIILMLISIGFSSTYDGPVTVTTSGTVPFVVSFNSNGVDGMDTNADFTAGTVGFAAVDDDVYDNTGDGVDATVNYLNLGNIMQCTDFDANYKFKVNLLKGGWSLPTGYTTEGVEATRKNNNGTDTGQFLVKITVSDAGYAADASEGIITTSTFGTQFTGLAETTTTVMTGGTNAHGVETGGFSIAGRILFDWLTDIPGDYSVDLTISVVIGD